MTKEKTGNIILIFVLIVLGLVYFVDYDELTIPSVGFIIPMFIIIIGLPMIILMLRSGTLEVHEQEEDYEDEDEHEEEYDEDGFKIGMSLR